MSHFLRRLTFLAALALLPAACGDSDNPQPPVQDAGPGDERPDGGGPGTPDAGPQDSGTPDSGTPDSGTPDSGTPDSGTPDSGTPDSGTPDGGADGGVRDAGPPPAFEGTPVVAHTTCGRTAPFFAASRSTDFGLQPRGVALADLNRDGHLDVAFARSEEVRIAFGEGTGRFRPAVKYAGGGYAPLVIIAADFNRDGAPDLVTTGNEPGATGLLLNNGDGSFTPSTTPPAGLRGWSLVAGDFNRDGNQDIAATTTGGLAVVPGRGDGTFGAPIVTAMSPAPSMLDAADMNGDGILDLGVTYFLGDHFTILLGQGDGTFPTRDTEETYETHYGIRLADFNADGRMDALVGNYRYSRAELHLGSGTGGFSSRRLLPTQTFISEVAAADVNGDGLPDAILRSDNINADVYVYLSRTASAFEDEPVRYSTGTRGVAPLVGDINSDGMVDIFISLQDANTFGVLYGNRGNILAAPQEQAASAYGSAQLSALEVADLDRDGRLDVIVADGLNDTVYRMRGQPDGGFGSPGFLLGGDTPAAIAVGSLDDNLQPDIAVANAGSDTVSILRQDNAGSAVSRTYSVGAVPNDVAIADLNGDGRNDVITANRGAGTVSLLMSTATGTFSPAVHITSGSGANAVAASDFNNDGRTDLAVANRYAGTVSILRNSGTGSFTLAQRLFMPGELYTLAAGHFNEDSFLDLAIGTSGAIEFFLGSATGFQVGPYQELAVGVDKLVLADMNGDLLPDILATSVSGRVVTLLAGRGDGTFAGPVNLGPRKSPGSVAAADLDGDGAPELLTAAFYGNRLQVSRNLRCGN